MLHDILESLKTAVREFRRRAWLRQYRASIKDPFTN
jgi:hypothetical protein